jgi:hypothetical protein
VLIILLIAPDGPAEDMFLETTARHDVRRGSCPVLIARQRPAGEKS